MKITKLILHKYRRFMLNNITTIEYTPDAKIQLIAGTNGSGKSSLLAELSPLPANIKLEFLEGGYKEIYIEHNNSQYTLISGKLGAGKHQFIVDGIELNDGNTKRVQLTLCQQHFKLTPELHEILIGRKSFTSMTVGDRKRWLSSLSTVDYDYPINIFNKLKIERRDIIGGIKLLNTKISALETSIVSEEQLNYWKEEHSLLKETIESLIAMKESGSLTTNSNAKEQLKLKSRQLEHALSFVKKKTSLELLKEKEHQLELINTEIKHILKQIEDAKKLEESSVDELVKEYTKLSEEKTKLESSFTYSFPIENAETVYRFFKDNHFTIVGYLNRLSEFSAVNLEVEHIRMFKDRLDKCERYKTQIQTLLERKSKVLHTLTANKNKPEIECNKCGNRWRDGFDEMQYREVQNEVESLISKQNQNEKILTETKHALEEIETAQKLLNDLNGYIGMSNIVKTFYEAILEKHNLTLPTDASLLITTIEAEVKQLEVFVDYNKIVNEIKTLADKIEYHKRLMSQLQNMNNVNSELLHDKLARLYANQKTLNYDIKEMKEALYQLDRIETLKNEVKQLLTILKQEYKEKQKDNDNVYYMNVIRTAKALLYELEEKIHKANNANENLKELSKELNEYTTKKRVLEVGIDALSPTKGLIAKSILSFLGVFVNNINHIINQIWSYKMELLPPEISEKNELDYKFRVNVEDVNTIGDIGMVSSGMGEVINLAFRMVVMHLMDINDYPLYLDEYGSKFDPVHRETAYTIAKELSYDYSQIFMVSHAQESFSLYQNADLIILSDDNLFMAEITGYNTKIKIT